MSKTGYKKTSNISKDQSFEGLKDFFDHHSLEESRNTLWKWLNVSGSRGFNNLNMKEREDLLVFYAHLQGLLEAAYKIKTISNTNDIFQETE